MNEAGGVVWLDLLKEVSPDRANSKEWRLDCELEKDLGIDSLSLMELVIAIEDVAGVEAAASDIRGLRTVDDVRELWIRISGDQ